MAAEPINVADYERLAEEGLEPGAFGYFVGGAGDEWTLRENIAAFRRWYLRPRMLVDVRTVTTHYDRARPRGVHAGARSADGLPSARAFRGRVATARGAAAAGTVMCLSSLAALRRSWPQPRLAGGSWFQLYWSHDRGFIENLLAGVVEAGFRALVLTVDFPAAGRRERDLRAAFAFPPTCPFPISRCTSAAGTSMGPSARSSILGHVARPGVAAFRLLPSPFLVKGVLTAEDAVLAFEHGVEGIVVSNHGGRQLDGAPASLEALPEVVEAVGGRGQVLLDGGVRRGADVVKALALGARAVLVGRPVIWGLAVDGEEGVGRVLGLLQGRSSSPCASSAARPRARSHARTWGETRPSSPRA